MSHTYLLCDLRMSAKDFGMSRHMLPVPELSGRLATSSQQFIIYKRSDFTHCHHWEAESLRLHVASNGFSVNSDVCRDLMETLEVIFS